MERLTVERADALCEKYGVRLGRCEWAPTESMGVVCPNGLLLLDALGGDWGDADSTIINTKCSVAGNNPMQWFHTNEHVCRTIADKVGVSHDYAIGLNNGFEDNFNVIQHDGDSEEFRQGFEDGEELAKYVDG
jgi:hypothetical protein